MNIWDILVLDRSASMLSKKNSLREGYNNLVSEQIKQGSKSKFTVYAFNTIVDIIKDEVFPNVSELHEDEFNTFGCTALLDAVGNVYDTILQNTEYEKINITIITDGMENSSKFYTIQLLDDKRKELDKHFNINLTFIGADMHCLRNNTLLPHVLHSVNCEGDMVQAMKTASRTMSSTREDSEYIPEGKVEINPNDSKLPILKRQHSSVNPPFLSQCDKFCRLN